MSRRKGKTYELDIIHKLKDIFPKCHRNWVGQSAQGGVDLANTKPFDIEVKGGKQANIAKARKWLDQVEQEGKKENYNVVIARPLREDWYVIMPFDDWMEILETMKAEKLI